MEKITFYGAELSYFSAKLRAYLRWKGIPFQEVTATSQVLKKVIRPRIGFEVMPVVELADGTLLQDTTLIIDALEERFPHRSVIPQYGVQRFVARLLELYADEWQVMPALHYRWSGDQSFILREWGRMEDPEASGDEARALGLAGSERVRSYLPLLGITAETGPEIEVSFLALLGALDRHFANHSYCLGDAPTIADCALTGPLYAHIYFDPALRKILVNRSPHVATWVERMAFGRHETLQSVQPPDALPETILPPLQRMAQEHFPVLAATAEAVDQWKAQNPDQTNLRRSIGMHEFSINGVRAQRVIQPFALWKFQRARDVYLGLTAEERQEADQLLDRAGASAFQEITPAARLEMRNYRIRIAD